jgi:hypothetical protein
LSFTYPQAQGKPNSGWEAQEVEGKALVGGPWEPNPNLWLPFYYQTHFYVNHLIILHNHATSLIISCDLVGACHKG